MGLRDAPGVKLYPCVSVLSEAGQETSPAPQHQEGERGQHVPIKAHSCALMLGVCLWEAHCMCSLHACVSMQVCVAEVWLALPWVELTLV